MTHSEWLTQEANRTLKRLIKRIDGKVTRDTDVFFSRLSTQWDTIFRLLHGIYGTYYDFYYHLEVILDTLVEVHNLRPKDLRKLDIAREKDVTWFQSEKMLGAVCYVDLFAENLQGIREKIPYFKELGVTYLHLMPLFKAPEKESDGGYAISDFRNVNPALGTMAELASLATEFRKQGISLVLDFVFNHTSHEHEWAQKALAGDPEYQAYYYMYPDRTMPNEYERNLREIFPEQAPGSFTFQPKIGKWVWTTFREFQWDLNYTNPSVFNAMLAELLFLANQGVEVIRLDAVAFIWKQLGTACENLPQAHQIIRAYNALIKVVAPALIFKSEAIVHPDMVATYIDQEESPLSYHPTMMALLWESLATRDVKLLSYSMQTRFALPPNCAWVNYVRVHDDIGWTFADEDAQLLGINGYWHRQFLNQFYIGKFDGSFAKGVPFNYNPVNQDMRISGMGASLAGLEQALERNDPQLIDHALKRILLIHSVIISAGGIPLIYLGDEIATMNDYSYALVEGKKEDSRWVHRPKFDWARAETRHDATTPAGWVFTHLLKLIQIRKKNSAFGSVHTQFFDTGNTHVLGYLVGGEVLVLANFSEHSQVVSHTSVSPFAHKTRATDLVTKNNHAIMQDVTLAPYEFVWLKVK